MSRVVTTETTVYTYDELSERAKETVRENHNRFLWECGSAQESMTMIFEHLLEEEGWENVQPESLLYDLYSQGGYPSWTGDKPDFEFEGTTYYVTARVRHGGGSSHWIDVDIEWADEDDWTERYWEAEEVAQRKAMEAERERIRRQAEEYVQGVSHKIFWAFREEDEYLSSDEQVRESCEANGYEFTIEGDFA